jgi:fatty acid desaturase
MVEIASAPYRTNVRLAALTLAAVGLQFFVVPLFLLPQWPQLALAVVLLLSLSTPLSRALLHEAIHGRLAARRNWNDCLGRALSVGSGVAFDAIRFGHLAHHRFPRHELDRSDVIEPGRSRLWAIVNFYVGLLGGIHLREIGASGLMLLPRNLILSLSDRVLPREDKLHVLHGAIRRSLDRRLMRARVDLFLIVAIHAVAFYLYGSFWFVLVAGIALRALIVSLQDNVAHYGTPALLGAPAHNSYAVRWASKFMLNTNLHGVHHERPELPWNALPQAPEAQEHLAGSYANLLLRQFQGPRRSFFPAAEAGQGGATTH